MSAEGKTIRQIAEEIGVSKQAVRKEIANQGLQTSLQKNGNQFAINESQEKLIIEAFKHRNREENANQIGNQNDNQTETNFQSCLRLFEKQNEQLSRELEVKNEQIRELNSRLAESNAALVAAQRTAEAAQLLHAGTMQKQLTDGSADQPEPDVHVGFFARAFGHKK